MKLTQAQGIALFNELGYKGASGWEAAKWKTKMDSIGDALEGAKFENAEVKQLAEGILAALKDGKKITIALEGEEKPAKAPKAEKNAEAKPTKKEAPVVKAEAPKAEKAVEKKAEARGPLGDNKAAKKDKAPAKVVQPELPGTETPVKTKKAKTEKAEKKAKPTKTEKVEKKVEKKAEKEEDRWSRQREFTIEAGHDKFGFRKGSMAAVVNATLGKSWKQTSDIEAETQVRRYRITDHFWKMIRLGFVEKNADKTAYRLTEKGVAAKSAKKEEAPKAEKKPEAKTPAAKPTKTEKVEKKTEKKAKKAAK